MKTAITGGIGSGKSFVCRQLRAHGIRIYDCDEAAKRLIRTSPELRSQLRALIGSLDKADIARFLLADEANARAIDAIVHPAVARDFLDSGYQWMECAILYESGFDRLVDRVVVVTAPLEVRIARVMQRDGISREKVLQWMDRQAPQQLLLQRADYEIVNDGTTPLAPQIAPLLPTDKGKQSNIK